MLVASDKVQWEIVSSDELGNSVLQRPIWLVDGGIDNDEALKDDQQPVVWVVLDQDQEQQFKDSLKSQFASEPQLPEDVEVTDSTQYPTADQIAKARFRGSDPLPFRSVSRSIAYGETLYPEMGFWVPSAFRQSEDYRFTFTGQLLGNPTNGSTPDWCNWEDFWNGCSDSQYLLEVTPLIAGPISIGLNYSQQESFLGERSDGDFDQAGQAFGFALKSNLGNNFGAAIVGQHLWSPYDKGGPNGSYPKPNEDIQADLGRSYLWLGSAAWDLGFWFGADTPAVLAVTGGLGNGRYKDIQDTQRLWINYGPYAPVGTVALALNSHISFFTEWSGQYNGFGLSVKPLKEVPLTGTLMFRDFQNTSTGIVNCQRGDPDNCRTTVDGRLTISF
ncbi:hypothetical protein SynBIOSU31_00242 [Synechococcus sp. BIOS-U3-1]|nr:hypothetical protein SynBIOSU31_00242 [Synechococcus sp. BIOS-U3-1]